MRRAASIGALAALLTLGTARSAAAQEAPCVGEQVAICLQPVLAPSVQLLPILQDGAIAIDRICVLPGSCPG